MRRIALLAVLPIFCVLAVAQEVHDVNVGVAPLQNQVAASFSPDMMRDRLVRSINDLKPDKKTGVKLRAIALAGGDGNQVTEEATQKQCNYVVYTSLLELVPLNQSSTRMPGTVQTNPNLPPSIRTPSDTPEYRATVEYKLYDLVRHSTNTGSTISGGEANDGLSAVSRAIDRVAAGVLLEIKKNPPKPRD